MFHVNSLFSIFHFLLFENIIVRSPFLLPLRIFVQHILGRVGVPTVTCATFPAYTVTALSGTVVSGTGAIGSLSAFTIGGGAAFSIPANFVTGTIATGDVFRFSVTKSGYSNNHSGHCQTNP
jgi:hypothetical protein